MQVRRRFGLSNRGPDGVSRGVAQVEREGAAVAGEWIDLVDDGSDHRVRVVMDAEPTDRTG